MIYMLECGKPNNKPSNNIQQHGPSGGHFTSAISSQVEPEVYSTQPHKSQVRMTILVGSPHYHTVSIILLIIYILNYMPWNPMKIPTSVYPPSQKSVLWLFSQPMLWRSFSVAAAEVLPTDPSYLQHLQAVLLGVSAAEASKDSDVVGKV